MRHPLANSLSTSEQIYGIICIRWKIQIVECDEVALSVHFHPARGAGSYTPVS